MVKDFSTGSNGSRTEWIDFQNQNLQQELVLVPTRWKRSWKAESRRAIGRPVLSTLLEEGKSYTGRQTGQAMESSVHLSQLAKVYCNDLVSFFFEICACSCASCGILQWHQWTTSPCTIQECRSVRNLSFATYQSSFFLQVPQRTKAVQDRPSCTNAVKERSLHGWRKRPSTWQNLHSRHLQASLFWKRFLSFPWNNSHHNSCFKVHCLSSRESLSIFPAKF